MTAGSKNGRESGRREMAAGGKDGETDANKRVEDRQRHVAGNSRKSSSKDAPARRMKGDNGAAPQEDAGAGRRSASRPGGDGESAVHGAVVRKYIHVQVTKLRRLFTPREGMTSSSVSNSPLIAAKATTMTSPATSVTSPPKPLAVDRIKSSGSSGSVASAGSGGSISSRRTGASSLAARSGSRLL